MRFDVTSLAGHFTTIKSATLRLFPAPFGILGVEGGAGPVTVYRLAAANTGWGGSTWNQRVPGFENWAGSAGASTPGIDFLTPSIASGGPEQGEAVHDLVFTDVSFIPNWVAGDNPGLLLQTEAFFGKRLPRRSLRAHHHVRNP